MEKIVLIDTNLYLDDADIIYKMSTKFKKILIPITVLKELDKKKYNKDLSYSARNAIQAILNFSISNQEKLIFDTVKYEHPDPDDRILESAKTYNAVIATKDIHMSITAKAIGLKSVLHDIISSSTFSSYVHVDMEDLHDITSEDAFSYNDEYIDCDEGDAYQKVLTIFSKLAGHELSEEYWWFIIINTNNKEPVIYANNPLKYKLIRIDNKAKYREIKTDGSIIKARDCYQVCAIYALEEAPHTLITGRWGSGKSLLASAHAIARNSKKTFITRAPIGINSKYDIGYLPGPLEDKMLDWLQGFMSALYYLYSNTRSDVNSKSGTSYDYVRDRIFSEKFQIIPMNTIQGLSLLDNDTLIVDEAQLIDISYMSMILSRPSATGKLILLGDLGQAYSVVKPSESGLLKLLRVLPHKYMAHVELQNSYRSPLLEVADKLIDKSLK